MYNLIRISAPHFVAGAQIIVIGDNYRISSDPRKIAPIIRYMKGWTKLKVEHYCRQKQWTWEYI